MDERDNAIEGAAAQTCEWLLEHDTYRQWISQGRGLLWLMGNPGAGKSTLLKFARKRYATKEPVKQRVIASFFFHGRGSITQKSSFGLFRSLLHQILSEIPSLLSEFTSLYRHKTMSIGKHGKDWEWHEAELRDFVGSALTELQSLYSITLFIDALDEVRDDTARDLIEYFSSIGASRLQICISCRYYPTVKIASGTIIRVEKENFHGLKLFVQERLAHIDIPSEEAETLEKAVLKKASGSFQWTKLVLQDLTKLSAEGRSTKELFDRLGALPTELNDLYQNLLESIPDERKQESSHLMEWILFAMEPLTVTALRYAMVIDADSPFTTLAECRRSTNFAETDLQMEKRITSLSAGLAEVVECVERQSEPGEERRVQFIHQTVVDYIRSSRMHALGHSKWKHFEGQSHFRLSRSCIKCLSLDEVTNFKGPFRTRGEVAPFLSYSRNNWTRHATEVERANIPQTDLLHRFGWPSDKIINHWEPQIHYEMHPERVSRTTALHAVISRKFFSALCSVSGEPMINFQDSEGRTPLHMAVRLGSPFAMSILIAKGAAIDLPDLDGWTPLIYAAGHCGADVANVLLDNMANPDQADRNDRTPLSYAASAGQVSVAERLVEKGAQIDAPDLDGRTTIMYAAENDQALMAEWLIGMGARLDATDQKRRTLLHWAIATPEYRESPVWRTVGSKALLKVLIDGGAVINAQDSEGNTALTLAIPRYHSLSNMRPRSICRCVEKHLSRLEATVFLLEEGAEISEEDLRKLNEIWSIEQVREILQALSAIPRKLPFEPFIILHKRFSEILGARGLIFDPSHDGQLLSFDVLEDGELMNSA